MSEEEASGVAREILKYLVANPDAQDTVEGITDWWLLEQRIKRETAEVRGALAKLVDKGWVIEFLGKDSQTHYRVDQLRLGEIQASLKRAG